MKDLKGKVAIVTGAASGIGRAVALLFAEQGADLVLADVQDREGEETKAMAEKIGARAVYQHTDVSRFSDHEKLVQMAVAKFGGLHVAVNNAGIAGASNTITNYPLEAWDKVIATNLTGVFYAMKTQIPEMLKNKSGAIVNISSILGQVGFAGSSAYTSAKHGLVGLTRSAALEFSAQGIRINSVGPAFIDTPMLQGALSPELKEMIAQLHPIGRMGQASEVAELVLWLSSQRSSFATGAYYPIDGGYLAR